MIGDEGIFSHPANNLSSIYYISEYNMYYGGIKC